MRHGYMLQGTFGGTICTHGSRIRSECISAAFTRDAVGLHDGLRRLVKSGAYDVVHNHLQVYSWLPAFACRNLDVPVITSFHCTEFPSDTTLRLPVLEPTARRVR